MADLPNRIFDATGASFVDDPVHHVRRLASNANSIIIATRGYIKQYKGEKLSRYGISFGIVSELRDFSKLIPSGVPMENKAAELYAVKRGLEELLTISRTMDLNLVVIKVSFAYLPKIIDEQVWGWENCGHITLKNKGVSFSGLIKDIHKLCLQLENDGIEVKFWLDKPRATMNEDARFNAWKAADQHRFLHWF